MNKKKVKQHDRRMSIMGFISVNPKVRNKELAELAETFPHTVLDDIKAMEKLEWLDIEKVTRYDRTATITEKGQRVFDSYIGSDEYVIHTTTKKQINPLDVLAVIHNYNEIRLYTPNQDQMANILECSIPTVKKKYKFLLTKGMIRKAEEQLRNKKVISMKVTPRGLRSLEANEFVL